MGSAAVAVPGLAAFGERDAGVFFGRRAETERLLELLSSSRRRHTGRLLAVVGPSGSGKSSLVAAGVLPRLRQARRDWIVLPTLRPGDRPLRQLALALEGAFGAVGAPRPLTELEQAVEAGPDAVIGVAEELAHHGAEGDDRAVLVVVDQAEELLTLAGPQEGGRFLELLHAVTGAAGPLWCLLTLRSEFLSALLQWDGGAQLFDDEILVGPLERARLAEVIERPAARAAIDLEPGLVARMVEDTGGGDALPLLAFTLSELDQHARAASAHALTGNDYDRLGGVVGALRSRADHEYQALRDAGLGDVVLPTLVRLVSLGPEGLPTRRRLALNGLTESQRRVIDAFVEARLVASGQHDGQAVVEVAHEALLRQWPPLDRAISRSHDDLRLRTELERAAADWMHSSYSEEYLLSGLRLSRAQRLTDDDSSITVKRLVAASEARERRKETADTRRRRTFIAACIAGLLIVALAISNVITDTMRFVDTPRSPEPKLENEAQPPLVWQMVFAGKNVVTKDYDGRLQIFSWKEFRSKSTTTVRFRGTGHLEVVFGEDARSPTSTTRVTVCQSCPTIGRVAEFAYRRIEPRP